MRTIPREQAEAFGAGMCVAMIEKNMYHDSYFSGIFAVPAEGGGFTFVTKETGATAFAGGFIPVEDATEEVLVAYRARREEVMESLAAERREREERRPTVGKSVTVVFPPTRGKNKVPAGAAGHVDRRVENDYDSWSRKNSGLRTYRLRVVMEAEDRVVWLDEDRVRVAGFEAEELPSNSEAVDYMVAAAWPAR